MQVRRLRAAEQGEVAALWHAARKETHTAIGISMEEGVTPEESQRVFRELIAPRNEIWVAEESGSLLGFLAIQGSTLERMYVRPDAQGRGVGTALLDKARELSPDGLELHTHRANERARRFYEKHGFEAFAFGVSPPPESEPDVEYRWRPR